MSANMTLPQTPQASPPGQAAQPAPAAAPMPWDQLDEQLRQLVAQEDTATAAITAAASAYNAIKDAPIRDPNAFPPPPGQPDPQAGAVSAEAKTQALNAYVAATTKLTELKQQEAQVAGDIATAKQKYQDQQDKLNPTPETKAKIVADTAAANAQSAYYGAQANEANARAAYLTSPEGKEKDAAAAALDRARADTEKAQQAYYGSEQIYLGAQTNEATANAALTGAKATAYPSESAAAVASNTAQAAASTAEAAKYTEELRQKRLGDLGAYIDSLATAQKAGLIDQPTADKLIAAKEQADLTGGTQFEHQKQAEDSIRLLANDALQSGNAVRPDQQYMVGGGPGGDIAAALGGLGIQFTPTRLQPASMPAYAASLGITTPASVAAATGVPAYAAGLIGPPAGLTDLSHLTPDQAHAALTGAAAPQPAAGPNAGSGVFDAGSSASSLAPGNVPPGLPPGATAGGVNNGLLLTAPITGAPNYARLPGT
jgi:hypothetical protein